MGFSHDIHFCLREMCQSTVTVWSKKFQINDYVDYVLMYFWAVKYPIIGNPYEARYSKLAQKFIKKKTIL